jgi:phosphoribosylanthranilate isomerase
MFVKICGITRLTDALHASEQGATALGFVFWPRSPRFIAPDRAAEIIAELPDTVTSVGVFVNESIDGIRSVVAQTRITTVQLHGDEPPAYADAIGYPLLRSVTADEVEGAAADWPAETMLLLDAADVVRRGGTGTAVDWRRAATLARGRRLVLAGGLTPANVAEAIRVVHPYGVDVSSGVEESPGVKDFAKVTAFLGEARNAFTQSRRDRPASPGHGDHSAHDQDR